MYIYIYIHGLGCAVFQLLGLKSGFCGAGSLRSLFAESRENGRAGLTVSATGSGLSGLSRAEPRIRACPQMDILAVAQKTGILHGLPW